MFDDDFSAGATPALALARQLAEADNLPFNAQGAEKGIGRKILEPNGAASNPNVHFSPFCCASLKRARKAAPSI
jgi:hypothetical protein